MTNNSFPIEKMCRICLQTENPHKIVTPCACRGSVAFVHQYCMEKWIQKAPNNVVHGTPSSIKCQICKKNIYFDEQWRTCPQICETNKKVLICFFVCLGIVLMELGAFIFAFYYIVSEAEYALLFLLFLFGGIIIIMSIVCVKTFFQGQVRRKNKKISIICEKEEDEAMKNSTQSQKNLGQLVVI